MQFGINKHEFFQRLTKLHEPVGRAQFAVFEKFTTAYLFQIAQEKSGDCLLIIYIKKFRKGKTEETHLYHAIREKLRHQFRHPGRALDLKTKDLIGHL